MICLTLSASTLEGNAELVRANRAYIDIAELRVDLLDEKEQERASLFPSMVDIPVILTLRRVQDGGRCSLSERHRRQILLSALDGGFAYVDIEEDIKRNEVESAARERGAKIIRSFHDFDGMPEDIYSRIYRLSERGDIAKAAVTPHSISDVLTLFRISDELKGVDKIIIGMGDWGIPTRILYRRVGSLLTFASASDAVAPGQITARDLKTLYHADEVSDKTAIYGIIGNPVMHSTSPQIHNPGFRAINYDAIYLPFQVDSVRSFFSLAEYLHMRGFSVTIPHKTSVLMFLGNISREVKQIGSCNTVIRVPGMWKGMNTDYYGFLAPISKDIESGRIRNSLVIGAGGAAQAIVWALRNRGVRVTVLNRTVTRADVLGKWSVFFFYPADFTFVCPTELEDLANLYDRFLAVDCEIYSVSCDTHFVHKAWHDASERIRKIRYPMLADPTHCLAGDFEVYIESDGLAERGSFIVTAMWAATPTNCCGRSRPASSWPRTGTRSALPSGSPGPRPSSPAWTWWGSCKLWNTWRISMT